MDDHLRALPGVAVSVSSGNAAQLNKASQGSVPRRASVKPRRFIFQDALRSRGGQAQDGQSSGEIGSMPEFRWDHVHLRSPDPEGTAQDYVDVFGATPVSKVKIGEGVRVPSAWPGLNLFIEQVPAETPAPPHTSASSTLGLRSQTSMRACGHKHRCGLCRAEGARRGIRR